MCDEFQVSPGTRPIRPGSPRLATWAIFATLVTFLPIPFFVPFWAAALVPVSFLLFQRSEVGNVGVCYGLMAALLLFGCAELSHKLIGRMTSREAYLVTLASLIAILAALSLTPIYKPGLDPQRPAVNIVDLFRSGIPTSQ